MFLVFLTTSHPIGSVTSDVVCFLVLRPIMIGMTLPVRHSGNGFCKNSSP
jgi:hypothetical protein